MSTKRILIVDDERLTRISLADFLQESGYETDIASDGRSAFQLQQANPFDVCIVDIRMPGMDGIDTILTLHRMASHSKFIIYTGSPQFTLPPILGKMGITDKHIVRKPITDMNLFVTLVEQLEK